MRRMRNSISLAGAILVAILVSLCDGAADNDAFTDFKISGLGETGELNCNSSDSEQSRDIPNLYEPVAWMRPNLERIYESGGKFNLTDNNWTLFVSNTTNDDLGVYHCMLLNASGSSSYYLVKVGLNAEGPYYFDTWDKYMWPTIIAICCFFGFLLITGLFILLYIYRYIPPKKADDDSDSHSRSSYSEAERKDQKEPLTDLKDAAVDGHKGAELKNGTILPKQHHNEYENPTFNHEDVSPPQHHQHHHNHTDHADHADRESSDEDATTF